MKNTKFFLLLTVMLVFTILGGVSAETIDDTSYSASFDSSALNIADDSSVGNASFVSSGSSVSNIDISNSDVSNYNLATDSVSSGDNLNSNSASSDVAIKKSNYNYGGVNSNPDVVSTYSSAVTTDDITTFVGETKVAPSSVSVTNSTFFEYFDENGNLRDDIVVIGGTLIFNGVFANLTNNINGVNTIILDKPVKVLGNASSLYDLIFVVAEANVTIENFTFDVSAKDLDQVITIAAENTTIVNNTIRFTTADADKESYAIYANTASGLNLTNNKIYFTSNSDGTKTHCAVSITNSDNVTVDNNLIQSKLPSFSVSYVGSAYTAVYKTLGLYMSDVNNVNITNNNITTSSSTVPGSASSFNTLLGVYVRATNDVIISGNNITTAGSNYVYGLRVGGYMDDGSYEAFGCDNLSIKNNLINSTTPYYYANGLQVASPVNVSVSNNVINAEANGIVYTIIGADMMPLGQVNVNYTSNNITGLANSVYGINIDGTKQNIKDNNIILKGNYTTGIAVKGAQISEIKGNNISAMGAGLGTPTGGDYTFPSQNVGILAVGSNTQINASGNNISTTGNYAVNLTSTGLATLDSFKNNVSDNYLKTDSTWADGSVYYNDGSADKNIIKDNVPNLVKTVLSADNVSMSVGDDKNFTIILKDVNANVLVNKDITLTVINSEGVNTTYSLTTNDKGEANLPIDFDGGVYTLSGVFIGDDEYVKSNFTGVSIVINKLSSTLVAGNSTIVYGNKFSATLTSNGVHLANQSVVFTVTNENGVKTNYSVKTGANGVAILPVDLTAGNYTISANFAETGKYNNSGFAATTVKVLPIDKINTSLVADNISVNVGEVKNFTTTLTTVKGSPLVNKTVVLTLTNALGESKNYTAITDAKGLATLLINLTHEGNYFISGIFAGDKDYNAASFVNASVVINNIVVKLNTTLTANNVSMTEWDNNFIAVLATVNGTVLSNKTVVMTVVSSNGTQTNCTISTNANGLAILPLNLTAGNYTVSGVFAGDNNYAGSNFTNVIIVVNPAVIDNVTVLTAPNSTFLTKSGENYTVTLKDTKGNPIVGQEIAIKLTNALGQSVLYWATTNTAGEAKLQINLAYPGVYNITANYTGEDNHSACVSVGSVTIVNSLNSTVLTADNMNTTNLSGKNFTATLKDINGSVLAGREVSLTLINALGQNKTYWSTTNTEGVAKLPINLAYPSTYYMIVNFPGNNNTAASNAVNATLIITALNV